MKKFLLAGVALSGLVTAGAASAADLPRRSAPPMAPIVTPAIPIFTWTGFYVGANAGYGWGNSGSNTMFVAPGAIPGFDGGTIAYSGSDAGFVGGGQAGYNYQIGSFVVGVETDIQWADLANGRVGLATGDFPAGFVPATRGAGIDWFGTARARAGFAFDRALIYATGGFAYGGGGDSSGINGSDTRTGWVLGGGAEYAFTNNLTFGLEGLWVNLDSSNTTGVIGTAGTPPVPVVAAGVDDKNGNDFFVARAKVNFKF
jgi:outer membrane immunogenic protein